MKITIASIQLGGGGYRVEGRGRGRGWKKG